VKEKEDGRPPFRGLLTFPHQPVGYKEWKVGSFYIRWQTGVVQQLKKWQPQIVINLGIPSTITNWIVMDWARHKGVNNIIWHCGWESQVGNNRALKIKKWLARYYLDMADNILVYSTKGAKYLTTFVNHPENIEVCYNGLEIDQLLVKETEYRNKGKTLREKNQLSGKKVFLYVGGMMTEKQIPLLLNAYQSLGAGENAVLWLVGDGPDLKKINNIIESKHLNGVKIWGRVIEDVDAFFAAADYFVLPGLGGLALNQALFWGLPCVVGDADGTEDDLVFDERTGFRFKANDQESLTNALTKCLVLPEDQRLAFGQAGRALIINRSNVNKMVDKFIYTIDNTGSDRK
jgi:glycosyltransferase involved in cell wall biosynthesis